jgi:hypothetical protein
MLFHWGTAETVQKLLAASPADANGNHAVTTDTAKAILLNSQSVSDAGPGIYQSSEAGKFFNSGHYGGSLMITDVPDSYSTPSMTVDKLRQMNTTGYLSKNIPALIEVNSSTEYLLVGQPSTQSFTIRAATPADAARYWNQSRSDTLTIQELTNLSPVLRFAGGTPETAGFVKTVFEQFGYPYLTNLTPDRSKDIDRDLLNRLASALETAGAPQNIVATFKNNIPAPAPPTITECFLNKFKKYTGFGPGKSQ